MQIEVRFKAYSTKNSDADMVRKENRLRGCTPGEPCIVWGQDIFIADSVGAGFSHFMIGAKGD